LYVLILIEKSCGIRCIRVNKLRVKRLIKLKRNGFNASSQTKSREVGLMLIHCWVFKGYWIFRKDGTK